MSSFRIRSSILSSVCRSPMAMMEFILSSAMILTSAGCAAWAGWPGWPDRAARPAATEELQRIEDEREARPVRGERGIEDGCPRY